MAMSYAPSQTLLDLLDQGAGFHVDYGHSPVIGLSDHLPMALTALDRLGAAPARLGAFRDMYVQRLEPVHRSELVIDGDNWRRYLGAKHPFAPYRQFFVGELELMGTRDFMRHYAQELAPGVAGSAFHGILRLAYGLQASHAGEIAAGMAAWAVGYQTLGAETGDTPETDDPLAVIRALHVDPHFTTQNYDGYLITGGLASVSSDYLFPLLISKLRIDAAAPDETFAKLTEAARILFSLTQNFTALHGLTGGQALRVILAYVDDPVPFLRHYFAALLAVYVFIGHPALPGAETLEAWRGAAPAWSNLIERALQSDDEHVAKIVDASREEDARWSDALYAYGAAKYLEQVSA